METNNSLRNICIIAHVDHGKTTLVDQLLLQAGVFAGKQNVSERVMDTMDLERERGITIRAKNASLEYQNHKINIVDTPGHADFGGEVERILGMVDGAILLVDAVEGPLPQTRFVLQKALAHKLSLTLLINKVDRHECRDNQIIQQTVDDTFDLFIDLGASEEQIDFPVLYCCARDGWCCDDIKEVEPLVQGKKKGNLQQLFNSILNEFPPPQQNSSSDFQMLVSNLAYSDFVGKLAIGKILSGEIKKNQKLFCQGKDDSDFPFTVSQIYCYQGLKQVEQERAYAGDIVLLAGCNQIEIGDTVTANIEVPALPRIEVEKPTIGAIFSINTSPYAGKEGEAIQSRKLRDRLLKEEQNNVSIKIENTPQSDQYRMLGRGELQFAIVIEQMRREGIEFMVGKPEVIYKFDENGQRLEPLEKVFISTPRDCDGEVTKLLQQRKGILTRYESLSAIGGGESSSRSWVELEYEIPTRGLLGIRSSLLNITKGEIIFNAEFCRYTPYKGELPHRTAGCLVSDRQGVSIEYALFNLENQGVLFLKPGEKVYEGMVIGEGKRPNDMNVNPCREKKLTNVRAAGSDELIQLKGIKEMTLDRCIEWIDEDEWIEVTPQNIRLRKKVLAKNQRSVRRSDRVL